MGKKRKKSSSSSDVGARFRLQSSGFRGSGLGFRVQEFRNLGFRVQDLRV